MNSNGYFALLLFKYNAAYFGAAVVLKSEEPIDHHDHNHGTFYLQRPIRSQVAFF